MIHDALAAIAAELASTGRACALVGGIIVAGAEPMDVVLGVRCPVARAGHLVALKLLARSEKRPNDQADLVALLTSMPPAAQMTSLSRVSD